MESIVYMFLNSNKEILYIGKTTSINQRMSQHFGTKDDWKQQIKYIKLFYFQNPIDMSIYEIYWINKYNPPYNKADNFIGYDSLIYLNENIPNKTFSIQEFNYKNLLDFDIDINEFIKILKNKTINLLDFDFDILKQNHTRIFIQKNKEQIKNVIYNILKNLLKEKSKTSSIFITHPEFYNKLLPNSFKKTLNKNNELVSTLIYVGYINIDNNTKEKDLEYNLFCLLRYLANIKSDKLNLIITSNNLKEEYKKIVL
jgi:hypothetical protein